MATLAAALERALQLHERGRLDEAETLYRQILARVPRHPETLHLLGALHHQRGRHETAIELVSQAVAAAPRVAGFHNSLGAAYRAVGRLEDAEASYRRALDLDPRFAEAASNLGNVLHQQGKIDASIECYRRALAIDPRRPEIHNNLGTALFDRGESEPAEACYRQAIALDPCYPDAHFHLGLVLLQRGDYGPGWREHEWRWRMASFVSPPRGFTQAQWRGEPLHGARIFIHVEQGFGDMLQFVRYVPLVAERGGRVVLEAPKEMMRLFAGIAGVSELVPRAPKPPPFEWHCPLMSLPLAFGTELATIPARVPYIEPDAGRAAHWRERLGRCTGLRIGTVLAGRRAWKAHYDRSMPADFLSDLTRLAGVSVVSLQKDRPPGSTLPDSVIDLAPELDDFADTAAAISALDLVITIDSAVAHLAGALGKPVWIMLPAVADWRWLKGRVDSPWYPTARLFRQARAGDWTEVRKQIADELRRADSAHRTRHGSR